MRIKSIKIGLTAGAALLGCASQLFAADTSIEEAKQTLAEAAEQSRQQSAGMTFEEFKASVYREPGEGGKFIVNGDTPIVNEKLLKEFFEKRVMKKPEKAEGDAVTELIVHQVGGLDAVWSTVDKRRLTYCVGDTFGQNYQKVVVAMEAAANAWEDVADIDYLHLSAQDSGCTQHNSNVLFDVRPVSNGGYLARAFFPGDSRPSRNILIDSSSFGLDPNGNLTLTGILRHELGHTLGFRHEHTRPDSGVCFEDNAWRPLTNYDAFSVMHYPQCNGQGDWSLTLTHRDKNGTACLYDSAHGFEIDPSVCLPKKSGNVVTEKFEGHTVDLNGTRRYGPFEVKPGTTFAANMVGAGSTPGDPDLYVKFDALADQLEYDCRPYAVGANEECSVDVPTGKQSASVMVHGYSKGDYTLTIAHTQPN